MNASSSDPSITPGSDADPERAAGGDPAASGGPAHDGGAEPIEDSTGRVNVETDKLRNIVLFLPRFGALLVRLIADPEVSPMDKALLGAVVLYVASPFDIIPDFIPVIGQLDDIYLVALCLLRLLNRSGPDKLRQHWEGPEDIVQLLDTVTDLATRYLPGPIRNKLREWVEVRVAPGPPPPSTPA